MEHGSLTGQWYSMVFMKQVDMAGVPVQLLGELCLRLYTTSIFFFKITFSQDNNQLIALIKTMCKSTGCWQLWKNCDIVSDKN